MLKGMADSSPPPELVVPETAHTHRSTRPRRTLGRLIALTAVVALGLTTAYVYVMRQRNRSVEPSVRSALSDHRFEEARTLLDQWVARDPRSATAHMLLGRLLLAQDQPQDALAAFDRARRLGHPQPDLDGPVGVILARSGRLKEAESHLLSARAQSSVPDPGVEEALARVFIDSFRLGPGLDAVDRWIEAAPNVATPWLWRAELDGRTGAGPDRMAEDYRQALRRDPDSDEARLGLAEILRGLGRHDEAITEYGVYLQKHPDSSTTLASAGLSALEAGNEEQARELLDRAVKANPANAQALDGLAAIALRRRESAEALALADRALAVDQFSPDYHYRRALALDRLEKTGKASKEREIADRLRREWSELEELRLRLLRSPTDRELQSQLALWLLNHGRDEEGVTWAKKIVDDPPGHPETAAALARHYEAKGELGLANYYRLKARGATSLDSARE